MIFRVCTGLLIFLPRSLPQPVELDMMKQIFTKLSQCSVHDGGKASNILVIHSFNLSASQPVLLTLICTQIGHIMFHYEVRDVFKKVGERNRLTPNYRHQSGNLPICTYICKYGTQQYFDKSSTPVLKQLAHCIQCE